MTTHPTDITAVGGLTSPMPALGFGTAQLTGDDCRGAVELALETGYRHLDTAQLYGNESAVGDALASSPVPREDVYLVTKVHPDDAAPEDVHRTTRESLERLGTGIDLLLLHGPSDEAPLEETIAAMNDLQEEGAVDRIGVSNFSVTQLEAAVAASSTPIVTNQVKYHPYHRQDDLLSYCLENGIVLTAYSPLAKGSVVGDERLEALGDRYGKSAAQVALRWLLQQPGVAAIPKASSREHVEANADVFDFELTDEEMRGVFVLGGEEAPPSALSDRLGLS
ncbi:aldo/keto reductase [Natrononativus amylolyticus]|uniref:aldo/keto reductase n=1 Tax=Natrononativus amylolyticus TaxID=2963434 RepID=UPI0020CBD113|nr:aldo/keto reductase [Natrononativus amylolyticus]